MLNKLFNLGCLLQNILVENIFCHGYEKHEGKLTVQGTQTPESYIAYHT